MQDRDTSDCMQRVDYAITQTGVRARCMEGRTERTARLPTRRTNLQRAVVGYSTTRWEERGASISPFHRVSTTDTTATEQRDSFINPPPQSSDFTR